MIGLPIHITFLVLAKYSCVALWLLGYMLLLNCFILALVAFTRSEVCVCGILRLASYETQNGNGETEMERNGKTKRNRKPHPNIDSNCIYGHLLRKA